MFSRVPCSAVFDPSQPWDSWAATENKAIPEASLPETQWPGGAQFPELCHSPAQAAEHNGPSAPSRQGQGGSSVLPLPPFSSSCKLAVEWVPPSSHEGPTSSIRKSPHLSLMPMVAVRSDRLQRPHWAYWFIFITSITLFLLFICIPQLGSKLSLSAPTWARVQNSTSNGLGFPFRAWECFSGGKRARMFNWKSQMHT